MILSDDIEPLKENKNRNMNIQKVLLFAAAFALSGCNKTMQDQVKSENTTEQTSEDHDHDHDHDGEEAHQHEDAKELALNNGKKWTVDESTRNHAQVLTTLAKGFEAENTKDLNAYHGFADKVDTELQALIKACTMKGPDHDALHLWLEPVLEGTKDLKNTTDETRAKAEAQQLSENIIKFNQFFS